MLRSLYSGISGLRSHQTMLDVTGNNIANVNTTGFKASATQFQDTLSQLTQGAGAPQEALGGTNPAQVGLGVQVAGDDPGLLPPGVVERDVRGALEPLLEVPVGLAVADEHDASGGVHVPHSGRRPAGGQAGRREPRSAGGRAPHRTRPPPALRARTRTARGPRSWTNRGNAG